MYTTLEMLKTVKACVPGYSRMISFFGNAKETKTQLIPLHAVALIGGSSDAEWALTNGCVLDKEQYDAFYRRHLPAVFKNLIETKVSYRNRHSSRDTSTDKNPILKELVEKCYKVHSFEEIQEHLEKLRTYNFEHRLFSDVLGDECWNSPFKFVAHCFSLADTTYDVSSCKTAFPDDLAAYRKKSKAPTRSGRAVPVRDDDDDENEEEETYHDMDEEDERPVASKSTPYWLRSSSRFNTKGQNIAAMLSVDPYDFMAKLKFKVPKGLVIKNDGEKTVLEAKVDNTKDMFIVLRTLTAKSEIADQDGDE